jgi:hypothetical protein
MHMNIGDRHIIKPRTGYSPHVRLVKILSGWMPHVLTNKKGAVFGWPVKWLGDEDSNLGNQIQSLA